jgi:hypothetical protein
MLTILCTPTQRHALHGSRNHNTNNDSSYQANIESLLSSPPLCKLNFVDDRYHEWFEEAKNMLRLDPQHRPTADDLRNTFGKGRDCCYQDYEAFVAIESPDKSLISSTNTSTPQVEPMNMPFRKSSQGMISRCCCGRGSVRTLERCNDCLREARYRV